jgi:putative copper resistance protein D/copper transport protein
MNNDLLPLLFRLAFFIASVLLIGSSSYGRWLSPTTTPSRLMRLAFHLGAVLMIASSLIELAVTAYRALLELSPQLYGAYMMTSRHGRATLARMVLTLALWWVGLSPQKEFSEFGRLDGKLLDRIAHTLLCLGILLTISLTSHAGARAEVLPIFADFLHLAAMTVWISAVAFTAFSLRPKAPQVLTMLERVSSVGLAAVITLTLTGTYAGLIRLWDPELLVETQYGQALVLKLGIVAIIIALAAINRFVLLPQMHAKPNAANFTRFWGVLKLEAGLLAFVMLASSNLSTISPPERGVQLAKAQAFGQRIAPWTLKGTATPTAIGGVQLEFEILGDAGFQLSPDARIDASLESTTHTMTPDVMQVTRSSDGKFHARGIFGMTGKHLVILKWSGAKAEITLEAK